MKHKLQTLLKDNWRMMLFLLTIVNISQAGFGFDNRGLYLFHKPDGWSEDVYMITGNEANSCCKAYKMKDAGNGYYSKWNDFGDAAGFFFANSACSVATDGNCTSKGISNVSKTGKCTETYTSSHVGKVFEPSSSSGTSIDGTWRNIQDWTDSEISSVLKGTKIMFYIAAASSWNQKELFVTQSSTKKAVTYASIPYSAPYCSPQSENMDALFGPILAASGTYNFGQDGYSSSAITPVAGGAYYIYDYSNTNYTCTVNSTALTASFTLSSNSVTEGSNVTISSSSKSSGVVGQTSKIKYFATNDNYDTFTSLTVSSSSLQTSGLAVGTWTICACYYDDYIYCKGSEVTLTITPACTAPEPTTANTPSAYSYTTATLTGTYPTTSGYCAVTAKGICYGTSSNPTTKYPDTTSGNGSISYSATGLNDNTTYHYCAYVEVGGTTYYGDYESFTTTACSAPNITASSLSAATYCKDTDAASVTALSVTADGGVGTITYQWKSSSSASGTYTNVSGATSNTYKPSTATAGTTYYKCIVSSASPCTSSTVTSSASGAILIDATSVAGTISGGSLEQCLGSTKTLTLNSYTGTIQWHVGSSTDFTPSASTAISGATNKTYEAPISEVGTKYYKAVVTNGVCPSATTVTAADITVNRKYQASDFNLSGNTQDYDGNPKTVTVAEKSGAGNGAITIKYAGSTTAPTNAGTYAITIDVAKSSTSPYYCAEEGLSIGTLTINKIDQPTAVTIDNETTSYCVSTLGTDIPLEASGGDGTGAYSFTITGGTVAADKRSISGSTLTVSGAGTVILQATRAADTNYNAKNSGTVTFTFTANGPKVFTLTNEGATALCGKGDGSSTGIGGSLRLTGSETGYSYQLKKDDANYGDPVAGTGSALTFPVTSSGVYTCTAYYGVDPSQCPTEMNVEDGGIVLVVNITPRLLPGTPTVRQYQAVTITSTNTEIDKWVLSGEGADAYTYDSTPNSITLKANTAGSPYRLIATTSAGCTATAVITVIADTENCVP